MPTLINNRWTLKKLLQQTYMHKKNRFDYKNRDVIKRISVKKVYQYELSTNRKRTTFVITSYSYPQYAPYKTSERRQKKYQHQYDVTISLDRLSLNVPVKLRVGSDAKWDFSASGKSAKGSNGRIIEGSNVRRGINGDFFFRQSFLREKEGILYGKNRANGPPKRTNPKGIIFLTKHEISVIKILMEKGMLKDD